MLARLDGVVAEATAAFEGFDYARALERTEAFFWWFCDDYVELVKARLRHAATRPAASARRAAIALDTLQRLLARSCRSPPRRRGAGGTTSVHLAAVADARCGSGRRSRRASTPMSEVLRGGPSAKTEAKLSQRAGQQDRVGRPAECLTALERPGRPRGRPIGEITSDPATSARGWTVLADGP